MSTQTPSHKYQVTLKNRSTVAERTMAFQFEKPPGFTFRPGQYLEVTLLNPAETDAEGNGRALSIASAPHEDSLMVATRMRDTAFKRVLANLPLGAPVQIEGPNGSLTLHNNTARPAVFIVGGIGITPVRSIIAAATRQKLPHKITLLYANRTAQSAAFTSDLLTFADRNPNFTFVSVVAEGKAPGGKAETGLINRAMLQKYVPDMQAPIYYLSGPAAMVAAMRKILTEAKVNEDNIRTEEFSGY